MRQHLHEADLACYEANDVIERILSDPPVTTGGIVRSISDILKPLHRLGAEVRGMRALAESVMASDVKKIDARLSACFLIVDQMGEDDDADPVKFILKVGQLLDPLDDLCESITEAEETRFENSKMRRS